MAVVFAPGDSHVRQTLESPLERKLGLAVAVTVDQRERKAEVREIHGAFAAEFGDARRLSGNPANVSSG